MGNQDSTITGARSNKKCLNTPTLSAINEKYADTSHDKHADSASPSSTYTGRLSSKLANIPLPPVDTTLPSNDPLFSPLSSPLPSISMFKPQLKNTNNSSYANVSNGITGTHIHSRISKIAAKFWHANMESIGMSERLEIACSIFFHALSSNQEMKQLMMGNLKERNHTIEHKALKYLDMIGWLLRNVIVDNIDLYKLLTKLGIYHQNMGIQMNHFNILLQSMHETFSYYFPLKYNIEVKYAMDEIISLAAQIMSGQDLSYCAQLRDISKSFQNENNIQFLQNCRVCLASRTGKEYFFQFLKNTFCDEIVLFLETICKFKMQLTSIQRFMVARDILRVSIKPDANFSINISYDSRTNILSAMEELERKFKIKEPLSIDVDFFSEAETEIHRLIVCNHWDIFVHNIKVLQSKSYGL